MHFLQLVVGIALCLRCWFTQTLLVQAGIIPDLPIDLPTMSSSVLQLTPQERDEITDAHNRYRTEVRPPASNMQRVVRTSYGI